MKYCLQLNTSHLAQRFKTLVPYLTRLSVFACLVNHKTGKLGYGLHPVPLSSGLVSGCASPFPWKIATVLQTQRRASGARVFHMLLGGMCLWFAALNVRLAQKTAAPFNY